MLKVQAEIVIVVQMEYVIAESQNWVQSPYRRFLVRLELNKSECVRKQNANDFACGR
jgi:hypothetical protein